MPLRPLCVAHLLLGMEPALKWGFCTKGQSTGENYFFFFCECYELEIASG